MNDNASVQEVKGSTSPSEPRTDSGTTVGIDGSSGSMKALRWAVERADRFGPVRPVATWQYPRWAHLVPIPPPVDQFRQLAVNAIEDATCVVDGGRLRPPLICRADAGPTLVDVGATENLIVVGTRGRSGLQDLLLGSVSSYVVSHTSVPVAVIPARAPIEDRHHRVVVGLDGSVNSMRGLHWALKHTPADMAIEAVHCWTYPISTTPGLGVIPRNVYEDRAHFELDEAVDAVTKRVGAHAHKIVRRVEYGDPRSVLRQEAGTADLLVIGARGLGGVSHLLLGSAATALIHRPDVATVVIPTEEH